jgi:hypothetical protein
MFNHTIEYAFILEMNICLHYVPFSLCLVVKRSIKFDNQQQQKPAVAAAIITTATATKKNKKRRYCWKERFQLQQKD